MPGYSLRVRGVLMCMAVFGVSMADTAGVWPAAEAARIAQPRRLREGSLLVAAPQQLPPVPEPQGMLDTRLQREVAVHVQRLAELDAIASLARRLERATLLARVDALRGLEEERYDRVMRALRLLMEQPVLLVSVAAMLDAPAEEVP